MGRGKVGICVRMINLMNACVKVTYDDNITALSCTLVRQQN